MFLPPTRPPAGPQTQRTARGREKASGPTPNQQQSSRLAREAAAIDFAQQHVMYCLQKLGQMQLETMFVISGLDYCQTLTNPFSSKAAGLIVPRSVDRKLDPHVQPEIFDVLVIHRFYGILVGEIETVGVAYDDQKGTEGPTDAEVAQRVKEAMQRLDKSENTVNSLAAGLNVRKTLILPYVTTAQFQRVLATDPQLEQTFIDSTACIEGKLARLVLTPDQLTLLSAGHDLVMLTGPTGTGKTAVLGLKGLQWLREGHDVHVPSTLPSTRASSRLIYYQLQLTLSEDPTMPSTAGKVHLHLFDICNAPGDKERVVNTLASASKDQELFVLMDEILLTSGGFSQTFHSIIQALRARVPKLHLWSATNSHTDIPTAMQAFPLTAPFSAGGRYIGGDITKSGSKVSGTPLMYRDVFVLTRSSGLHGRIFFIPPSRF
ncbi:hypothetical protein BaRGS_00029361, partial [Batillaria attramentaria]